MILHLSTILDRPQLATYQLKFYTFLWSRHGSRFIENGVFEGKTPPYTLPSLVWRGWAGPSFDVSPDPKVILLDWFRYALFGRHTTAAEVEDWLQHCKEWLPAEYTEGQVTRIV